MKKKLLEKEPGIQPFAEINKLNKMQEDLKPHNEQPSDMTKLYLLLISFGVMGIVYFVTKQRKK